MEFFTRILTPSKSNATDLFIGGEYFLRILCSYPELRDIVFHGDFIICCPSSSSLVGGNITKSTIMSHILMPDTNPGEYKTINGKFCAISGHHLLLGDGFPQMRRIRILSTSHRAVDSGASVTIFHTTQPFTGGMRIPEDYDEISSVLVNKYVAALSTFPNMEAVINEVDDFVDDMHQLAQLTKYQGYDQLQPSLRHCLMAKWKYFSHLIASRLPNSSDQANAGSGTQLSLQQIEQIVESYIFKGLGQDVSQWLHNKNANLQQEFLSNIEQLSDISQQDLDISEMFQTSQAEAIQLLLTMPQRAITPSDKLLFMKEVVMAIQETIDRHLQGVRIALLSEEGRSEKEREAAVAKLDEVDFATDDLIPILIWVLIQAFRRQPDVYIDLLFAKQFHFVQAATSPIAFTTCHYDVAMEWLSNPKNFPMCRSSNKRENHDTDAHELNFSGDALDA